jgi:hypothetical protein
LPQRTGWLLSYVVLRKHATGAMALSAMLKIEGSWDTGLATANGGAFVFEDQEMESSRPTDRRCELRETGGQPDGEES